MISVRLNLVVASQQQTAVADSLTIKAAELRADPPLLRTQAKQKNSRGGFETSNRPFANQMKTKKPFKNENCFFQHQIIR